MRANGIILEHPAWNPIWNYSRSRAGEDRSPQTIVGTSACPVEFTRGAVRLPIIKDRRWSRAMPFGEPTFSRPLASVYPNANRTALLRATFGLSAKISLAYIYISSSFSLKINDAFCYTRIRTRCIRCTRNHVMLSSVTQWRWNREWTKGVGTGKQSEVIRCDAFTFRERTLYTSDG